MAVETSCGQKKLTKRQQEALSRFPVGEWVNGPFGVHVSTLNSLIKRGILEHKTDPNIPDVIFGIGKPWCQHLSMGTIKRII